MKNGRSIVIIVDDDITNLTIAKNTLTENYDAFTVPSGKKLFQLLEKLTPNLILLDVEMPEMDGYEVIERLKSNEATAEIPVIFVTANIDPESEVEGLSLGAIDYITKPFSRELLLKRIEVHLLVEAQRLELKNYSQNLEKMVSQKTKTVFELQSAILKTVAELVESRDNITGGHIERTQSYLKLLVDCLLEHGICTEELSAWDINLFVTSSQLHDVGKISIKDSILMKPGKLTDEEFEEMKKHAVYGIDIVEKIEASTPESAFLRHAKILAGSHHEKWNGSGYPYGFKGEEIPLQGRLMAIVDVYDALTNDRPYKKAFPHEEAVKIIRDGLGTHFDPVLGDIFLRHEKDFKHIMDQHNTGNHQLLDGNSWKSVSNAVAAIMDARSGTDPGQADRMRHHLTIFINALLKNEHYKDEVSSWDIDLFLLSAQLHDVGKIAIRDSILQKPSTLSEEEYSDVKTHANFGVKVVKQIGEDINESLLLNHAEAMTGGHHENWDGSGYPLGLRGRNIPLQARLMAIVDVYDALTIARPGRRKMSHKEAVEMIQSYSGTHFDPELVSIFLDHQEEFAEHGQSGGENSK